MNPPRLPKNLWRMIAAIIARMEVRQQKLFTIERAQRRSEPDWQNKKEEWKNE